MNTEPPRPNEAAAEIHKALKEELNPSDSLSENSSRSSITQKNTCCSARYGFENSPNEISKLKEPGGFRRGYLNAQADEAGIPEEKRPVAWKTSLMQQLRPLARAGYFDAVMGARLNAHTGEEEEQEQGYNSDMATGAALLKTYVGSGIMFVPSAFKNGGWLFCCSALLIVGAANFLLTHMLVQIRAKAGYTGLADMGKAALGIYGKRMVQLSLVVSQFGVCIAYMIFVVELGVSVVDVHDVFILIMQLAMLLPLCLLRSVESLYIPNLIGNVLILGGLFVVACTCIHHLSSSKQGISPDFKAFEPNYGLFIGTAIYAFEGTPLLMPIANAMAEPANFWRIFTQVFSFVLALFTSFGLLGYACYGQGAEIVVVLNMPRSGLSGLTKLAYCIALTCSWPLMFLPAIKHLELGIFGVVKKGEKVLSMSACRIILVFIFAIIALACDDAFDKFIAIVGATCCGPIMLIYPPLFHLVLCAESTTWKAIDIFMLIFGAIAIILIVLNMDGGGGHR